MWYLAVDGFSLLGNWTCTTVVFKTCKWFWELTTCRRLLGIQSFDIPHCATIYPTIHQTESARWLLCVAQETCKCIGWHGIHVRIP